MALTKKQLEQILDVINKRMLSMAYEALGETVLTPAEITTLKAAGLLREGTRNMIADPVALGKLVALVPPSARAAITYDQVMAAAKRMSPPTGVELEAIEYAKAHAGVYIKGIRDDMLKNVEAGAARAGGDALRAIQNGVAEAIAKRKTSSQLKTALFDSIDDRSRDWQRVAHTEINNAIQHGVHAEIRAKSDEGENQLIFKRPNPDACKHCRRVYLQDDGITPKVFKLKDLEDSNIGLKADSWGPTIGAVHPWCNCQLQVMPEGFDFVKMDTAKEKFTHDGQDYNPGQIIDADVHAALPEDLKSKTRKEAVLSFVGDSEAAT